MLKESYWRLWDEAEKKQTYGIKYLGPEEVNISKFLWNP
jgi:hypothetical protein